jgi:hypothetical protein
MLRGNEGVEGRTSQQDCGHNWEEL